MTPETVKQRLAERRPGLTEAEMQVVWGRKIPVTRGGGVGLCGELTACFTPNPIIGLDATSEMPAAVELALLKAYQTFVVRTVYREGFADRVLGMDAPAAAGHNTCLFRKGGGRWYYRRMTWCSGPTWYPPRGEETLAALVAEVERLVPERWAKWLANNPTELM